MIKQKGLKAVVIAMLIILSTSCFALLFVTIYKINAKNIKGNALDLGTLDGYYVITDELQKLADNYQKYDKFYIKSSSTHSADESFTTFMEFLKKSTYGISPDWKDDQYNGSDIVYDNTYFEGKKVFLCSNVSVTVLPGFYFNGDFDGQGNTISYENSNVEVPDDAIEIGRFCQELGEGAKISNVRISNVQFTVAGGDKTKDCAGIVGTNYGTVKNCIVQDISFISDEGQSDECRVAGLVGINEGVISECMVVGTYYIETVEDDDGIESHYFTTVVESEEAEYCIFAADVIKGACAEDNDEALSPSEHDDSAISEGFNNFEGCINAFNGMNGKISQIVGDNGYAFYKYKSTSYGYGGNYKYCVYLRSFIDWKTVTFEAEGNGTVSRASIVVPSDYVSVNYTTTTTENDSIFIYGSKVVATPNKGYIFDKWSNSGNVHTASFVPETYKLKFRDATGSCTASPDLTEMLIKYGDTLYAKVVCEYEPLLNCYYIKIIYSCDTGRVVYEYQSWKHYDNLPYTINYGTLNGKRITGSGIVIPDLGNNGTEATINPTTIIKKYDITFG